MKSAWKIIITIVLIAVLLGGVSVAVGLMTGAEFGHIYTVLDNKYSITYYREILPDVIAQVEQILLS